MEDVNFLLNMGIFQPAMLVYQWVSLFFRGHPFEKMLAKVLFRLGLPTPGHMFQVILVTIAREIIRASYNTLLEHTPGNHPFVNYERTSFKKPVGKGCSFFPKVR